MKLVVPLFLLLLITAGCRFFKGDPYKNTPVSGFTTIAVDETFRPVMEAESDLFKAIYGYSEIKSRYLPEAGTFRLLMEDSVQLIVASRKLRNDEISFLNSRKLFPKQLLVALDAIALIVHPSCKDSIMSMKQIRELLGGKITGWEQLNSKNEKGYVRLLFDNEKSGIVAFLSDSVCRGNFVTGRASALHNSREVIEYTATHPGVIGFVGTSWISNSNDSLHLSFHKKIKVLSISESDLPSPENSYKPYQAYLLDHRYPLTRSVYLINAEPRSGLSSGFVSFVSSDKGQRVILKSGILPAVAPARIVNIRPNL